MGENVSNGENLAMKDKFKLYLEEHFRKIAPTQAAMEYRKQLLTEMLDKAHELRIKGLTDDELIYDMVIDSYGDMDKLLKDYERQLIKKGAVKRKVSTGIAVALAVLAVLTLVYIIVSVATNMWSKTWLIEVGGIFAALTVVMAFAMVKLGKAKKYTFIRLLAAACEILLAVFVYLLLELVFEKLEGVWLTFLAMVVLVLGVDTAIAFLVGDKLKWIELPIFIEVFCVMMYVILGIILDVLLKTGVQWWHPGWVLCLVGVVFAAVEFAVFMVKRNGKKHAQKKKRYDDKYIKTDESYWSDWGE